MDKQIASVCPTKERIGERKHQSIYKIKKVNFRKNQKGVKVSKKILLVLLAVFLLLGACAPVPEPEEPAVEEPAVEEPAVEEPAVEEPVVEEPAVEEEPEAPQEPVEITWLVRADEIENAWESEVAIPQFEADNPNITVKLIYLPGADFDTKLQSMIAGGTPPDVFSHWGSSGFRDYYTRDLLADLAPYIERDGFDTSDFVQDVLDIYTVDGQVLGLPILSGGTYMFYNKDLLDYYGVDYPPTDWDDTSWTVDAYIEKCGELTQNTDDIDMGTFGCHLGFWPSDGLAWLYGGGYYPEEAFETGFADEALMTSDAVVNGWQLRQDMVWKYHYMPQPSEAEAFGGTGGFTNSKIGLYITGAWGWWQFGDLDQQFNWGVAALPYGAANRKNLVFTDPWMISKGSNHPEEAWKFVKFLASPEIQREWMELTGAPPVRTSLINDWAESFTTMSSDEVMEVYLGSLKHGIESPNHLMVRFDQLDSTIGAKTSQITNNEKSALEVLEEIQPELEAVLQQIAEEYK